MSQPIPVARQARPLDAVGGRRPRRHRRSIR
jgi:hypothetical protein